MKAILTLIALILIATVIYGCGFQNKEQVNKGKTELKSVEETLFDLGLNLKNASLVDEPPGKLRILEFTRDDQPTIQIILDYKPDTLFSVERDWSEKNILKATVLKVNQNK